jgi:hypothetical protein
MPTIRPQLAAAPQQIVDVARHPHGKPLHAARECALVPRFHDQVNVVVLNRKVHDAKTLGSRGRSAPNRQHQCREKMLAAQRVKRGAHGHVHWMRGAVRRPGAMTRSRARPRLSTCPFAGTAPPAAKRQSQLHGLGSASHLE